MTPRSSEGKCSDRRSRTDDSDDTPESQVKRGESGRSFPRTEAEQAMDGGQHLHAIESVEGSAATRVLLPLKRYEIRS